MTVMHLSEEFALSIKFFLLIKCLRQLYPTTLTRTIENREKETHQLLLFKTWKEGSMPRL